MNPTNLIMRSFFSPKLVFDVVVKMELQWRTVIEAALFVSVMNALLTHLFNVATYSTPQNQEDFFEPYMDLVLNKPLLLFILEFGKIFFITSLLTFGGRLFSGSGLFLNSLKGVVWIHFVLIFINIGLFIALQLNIDFASYLIVLTNFWIMWVLAECAVKTHGFKSTFIVFIVGIVFFFFVLALLIQVIDALGFNFLNRVGFSD